jgi:hypothetical protein
VALARQVIAGDAEIDRQENRVEEECLKMLALHQPVAVDLRRIAAVVKINTDLERMADLAVDIAERALRLAELPFIPVPEKLQRMTNLTTAMVRQSLEAFVNLDTRQARTGRAAGFSYANYRWLKWPTTTGLMALALAFSLALIGGGHAFLLSVALALLGGIAGGVTLPVLLRLLRLDPRVGAGPIALAGADILTTPSMPFFMPSGCRTAA